MMTTMIETFLWIGGSFTLSLVPKATVITTLALIGIRMARRSTASLRHLFLGTAFVILLALPLAGWIGPTLQIKAPVPSRFKASAMANRSDLSARIAAVLDVNQRRGRSGMAPIAAVLISSVILTSIISPLRVVSAPALGQSAQAATLEVASIKPSRAAVEVGSGLGISPGGRFIARNTTLEDLVWFAYGNGYSHEGLISGGPDWVRSARFDIEAKAAGTASPDQLKLMLRSLLADRFKLNVHEESKQLPVYDLVLTRQDGKIGSKLRATPAAEAEHCASMEAAPPASPEFNPDGTKRCSTAFRGGVKMRGRPIADLVESLSELLERTVIDKTGLAGRFDADLDATLNWDHLVGGGPADTVGANGEVFTLLQEQLGLKLQSGRGSVKTIVIDSAQTPAEN